MNFGFSQIDLKQEASKREQIYFIVILLLIFVTFARWFYIPKIQQVKITQIEIRNNNMQIDTLKQFAKLRLPTKTDTAADDIIKTGTKFEKAVEASRKSQQQVVADIVQLLTSNNVLTGVSLVSINFGSESGKAGYTIVPLTIDLEGRYTGLLNYLERVEKFGRLITIDNVELNVNDTKRTLVNAKVNASIYVVNSSMVR